MSEAVRRLGVDRAGLYGVLTGEYDVSRDLAYKLGTLMRAYQQACDLAKEQDKRAMFKATIARMQPPELAVTIKAMN